MNKKCTKIMNAHKSILLCVQALNRRAYATFKAVKSVTPAIAALTVGVALSGCVYTEVTIKAPKGQPGPTIGQGAIRVESQVGYKGNAGSAGGSATSTQSASADLKAPLP